MDMAVRNETSRRGFIGGAAAFAALAGCRNGTHMTLDNHVCEGQKRWYKGNLHMHTFWSDGKAFPEEAVAWYKSRGYKLKR